MLEGLAARATLSYGSVDLIVSRGALMGYYACCTVRLVPFSDFEDKAEKGGI